MKDSSGSIDSGMNYAAFRFHCGKFRDTLDFDDRCCRIGQVSSDRVKQIGYSLLESVMDAYDSSLFNANCGSFACGICEGVLRQPTTTPCGHTFCRNCLLEASSRTCNKCDQKISDCSSLETNVLVKCLVEKFWSANLLAAAVRDEGNDLLQRNESAAAVEKFNKALDLVPEDPLSFYCKSQALYRLGKFEAALTEAENVIRLRPHWGKGYLRKGFACLAMGAYGDALVSFCLFVALDRNPQRIRHDVCKVLHVLLSDNLLERRSRISSPFASPPQPPVRRARYFHRSSILSRGDDEDHSGGEEDFIDDAVSYPKTLSNFYVIIDRIFAELDKLKRSDRKSADLSIQPLLIDKSDFDCVLCCRTMWKPVTTPCGHSYCLVCLDRSLDYSSSCPLCMNNLADYTAVTPKSTTEFLCKALKMLFPKEYLSRQIIHEAEISELVISDAEKEPKIPVFVCTTAYPSIHCPLFIYEPRYRLMVRRCVEAGTRQFGIAACFLSEEGTRRYADFGTILEIKDLVLMSDGCSILSTVGVRRFRAISRSERDGYDTAGVEFLVDEPVPDSLVQSLTELHDKVRRKALSWIGTFTEDFQEQVVGSFGTVPDVEDNWLSLPDGPSWTWWLLTILPLGPQLQVSILGTTKLEKRLRAIDKALNQIRERFRLQSTTKTSKEEDSCPVIASPRVEPFSLSTNCPFRRS